MSDWLTDPELFLYAKGTGVDDVHLWRCKKPASSSSLVVPMKPDDFDYVCNVKNHLELIIDLFDWDESDFKRLVEYIYEKHLLVNSQGFVFVELLHKGDKDGNKTIDDANEEDIPAIYIRSLDVLPLKPYIPKLRERPIPLRTVKYLGDVNGKAPRMEEDSNVTKLTARVADLVSKNKTLDTNVTKLTAGLATTTGNVADLQSKNKTLEAENKTLKTNVTKLTKSLATTTGNVADLQSKNKALEAENKILEGKVTKLTADLVTQMTALSSLSTLQQEVKNINAYNKEGWVNGLTSNEWVGVEGLEVWGPYDDLFIVGSLGTFTVDDSWTNVRAKYWYKIKKYAWASLEYKAVSLEDLTFDKEKIRSQKFQGLTATPSIQPNLALEPSPISNEVSGASAQSAITWVSRLQKIIALSTTEAEYVAATEASKEMVWLKSFLEELGIEQGV